MALKTRISKVRDFILPAECDPVSEQALSLLLEDPIVFQIMIASTE